MRPLLNKVTAVALKLNFLNLSIPLMGLIKYSLCYLTENFHFILFSEGRASAAVFDCKFIETSAAMQHNVWPLFEGIIRQLRLRRDSLEALTRRCSLQKRRESLPKKAKRFINKLIAKKNKQAAFKLKSKSCHDLMSL